MQCSIKGEPPQEHPDNSTIVDSIQPPAEVCLTDLAWDYPGV